MKISGAKIKLSIGVIVGCLLSFSGRADDSALEMADMSEAAVKVAPTVSATSLTDYVQQGEAKVADAENKESAENAKDKENKTWLNTLVDTVAEKGTQAISSVGGTREINMHRSNASVFDISGVMLRMNIKQVEEAMKKRSYQKTSEKFEIPNFIRWRYEEECRNQGVVGYERISNCVVRMAQKNNYQYIQQQVYNNFRTKESMEIHLTSNFTGNKVYRVMYNTEAANIRGNGPKADYLRNIKIYDFWKKINQKYGVPDNKEQVIWGLGENKPFLQAETGRLVLYDPMLLELDYTRMSREDQRFLNTAVYTF